MNHKRFMKRTIQMTALLMMGCLQGFAEAPATNTPPNKLEPDDAAETWSFSAYTYTYFQENARDYIQPTFKADRGVLHLEGRYNYEDYETASVWVGYNYNKVLFKEMDITVTPMIGGALGETRGFAPGFEIEMTNGNWSFSSEGEYFFDSRDSGDDFFYNWSELSYGLECGARLGLVMQKETDAEVKRGLLVGYDFGHDRHTFSLTGYFFDLDKGDPMFVIGLGWEFE